MSELRKTTITTLEVAEMMEMEHKRLLRKLEGDKERKGYIQILTESQMGLSDYFIPSTYRDASGKENKCYEVTKLGCDFLANKSTGEKGVLFTARYVRRFYEMENQTKQIPAEQIPIGEIASYVKAMDRVFVRQGLEPHKIAEAFQMVSEQFGIHLPANCVKVPEYEQMKLSLEATAQGQEEVRKMLKEIDKTIEAICGWVQRACKDETLLPDGELLPDMVKALAELVSARAKWD